MNKKVEPYVIMEVKEVCGEDSCAFVFGRVDSDGTINGYTPLITSANVYNTATVYNRVRRCINKLNGNPKKKPRKVMKVPAPISVVINDMAEV